MPHTYLPISLSLKNRKCLVVGGGNVAVRKVETLLDYESDITVIAPEITKKLEFFAESQRIKVHLRPYESPEATHFGLVVSASDDATVNEAVYDDCQAAGIPVNVVDNPPLCDFIFPAVLRRDCLSVAVSTDGQAPFLSGHLRYVLENIFPEHWTKMSQLAAAFRKDVQRHWQGQPEQKKAAFERFVEADWKEILKEQDEAVLQDVLNRLLTNE